MLRATTAVIDALSNLLRAHEYADEVGVDPWQFALEWRLMKARGLEETDVRYLVARGLVEFRREISLPAAFERRFIAHEVPRLSHDTAFVLTPAGLAHCRTLCELTESFSSHADPDRTAIVPDPSAPARPNAVPARLERPQWNPDRRELSFREQLVKFYRVPSPNQELILSVFQEDNWPEFIDDPLPPHGDVDPHRRLQATVKSLNRHQTDRLIRFRCNRSRVFWQPIHCGE